MIIDELIKELRSKGYSIGEYTSDVVESDFVGRITKNRNAYRRKKREKKFDLIANLGMNNLNGVEKDNSEFITFNSYPTYYRFILDNRERVIYHKYRKNQYVVKVRREH